MGSKHTPRPGPAPTWRGIEALGLIAFTIDGHLSNMTEQLATLGLARGRAHLLDDYTVNRVLSVHCDILDMAPVLEEQLARWSRQSLQAQERAEVTRLVARMVEYRRLCEQILNLAEALQPHRIEAVMGKSDEQLGLAHLVDCATVELAPPREVGLVRQLGTQGEPAVRFTHEQLGLLGFVFVKMASDGGLDVQASVADREVEPALAQQRRRVFEPLADRFLQCLANQVRKLNRDRNYN